MPTEDKFAARGDSSFNIESEALSDTLLNPLSSKHVSNKGSWKLLRPYLKGITGSAIYLQVLSGITYGYNTAVVAGANTSLEQTHEVSTFSEELIVSSILFGATIGSLLTGVFADVYGRRPVAIAFALTAVAGSIFLSLAPSITTIIIARGILGLSVGGFTYISPLYSSETSPPSVRGFLGIIVQLSIVFFIFVGYLSNLVFVNTPSGWRYMYGLGIVGALLLLYVCVFQMVESPRWLVLNGKEEEAKPYLAEIFGTNRVSTAIAAIKESNKGSKASWGELFARKHLIHLAIGFMLAFAQQLTGNNTVTYYAPKILEDAGLEGDTVKSAVTVGIGFFKFLCILIAVRYIDHFGRRFLLLIGLFVMFIGGCGLGISFLLLEGAALVPVALVFMLTLVGGLEMGPGPIFYILMSEIFPDRVRGRAMSLTNGLQNAFNLGLSLGFLSIINAIGGGPTFFIFAGVALISVIFFYFTIPETKGRTLEEVQVMLAEGHLY